MTAIPGSHAEIEVRNLPAHVALCRERYANLNRRLLRLEVLYGALVTILASIAIRLWTA